MISPGLTMLMLGMVAILGPAHVCHAHDKLTPLMEQWQLGFIEGSIRSNPHLREFRIVVNIKDDDSIALDGAVDSTSAKALAEQIAINVSEGKVIENRLQIEEQAVLADSGEPDPAEAARTQLANVPINNKVMSRILGHAQTRSLSIEARTDNRVVTVRGTVNTSLEKELVYWLVKNTDGVVDVVDKIEIVGPHQIQAGL